jgi:uncharacterized repeat protein (TIGR01451 family)
MPSAGVTDPVSGNNVATDTNPANTQADLAIAKSGPASVVSNGAVSYTLVVSNAGPAAANGAVVTDAAVSNFVVSTVSCGAATGGAVCPVSPTVPQLQAGLVIPTLPSGGSVTLTVTGTAGASGSITNVATVAPPVGISDPVPGNNSSTASTVITAVSTEADLAIAKGGPTRVVSNGVLVYTLVVRNNGPASANGAVVTDPAVPNFAVSGVSCGMASGGAVCPVSPTVPQLQAGLAIPVLPSGGSVTLTLTGFASASGAINNIATVTAPVDVTDPVPGNNSSSAGTTIVSPETAIPVLNAAMLAWLAAILGLLAAAVLAGRRR